ncbi:L-ribulose-5-phosphate 3-epimerase [Candidatus Mycoplasma pogonae]
MKSTNTDNFLGIYEKAINNKFDFEDKIKIAKQAGFDFIELSIDESDFRLARLDWSEEEIDHLKTLLIKHDFYFNSMCLSGHRRFPFGSKNAQTRAIAAQIMEKAIVLAKKLGIRIIQLAAYDVYYEQSDAITYNFFIEGIKKAVELAEKYNVMLAFETMDTPFVGTIEKAMKFVKMINSPYLKVYPDLGNLSQFSPNPVAELKQYKEHLIAFHFKDTLKDKFKEVPFGAGTVDFVTLLKTLEQNKFQGPILIEMWSKNDAAETIGENVAELVKAKNFFYAQKTKKEF